MKKARTEHRTGVPTKANRRATGGHVRISQVEKYCLLICCEKKTLFLRWKCTVHKISEQLPFTRPHYGLKESMAIDRLVHHPVRLSFLWLISQLMIFCYERENTVSLFVWLWLVVNDRKFPAEIVFFSHINQPAVLLHEPATKRTSQPNRLNIDGRAS